MIRRLTDVADRNRALAELEEIFFVSAARKTFASDVERSRFLATWTGWYLREAPDDVLLSLDAGGSVAGYLTGCRDSAGTAELFGIIPRYDAFADLFGRFPAHLHVNVHPDHRNRGVGAELVEAFAALCRCGLHIVTAAESRNTAFYARQGFSHTVERNGMLFMGREWK